MNADRSRGSIEEFSEKNNYINFQNFTLNQSDAILSYFVKDETSFQTNRFEMVIIYSS